MVLLLQMTLLTTIVPEQVRAGHLIGYESFGLLGAELGSGKDATAYELGTDFVYRVGHVMPFLDIPEMLERVTEHGTREVETFASLPANTRVARTLSAWVNLNRIHKIVERAEGEPLYPSARPGELIPITEYTESWERGIAKAAKIPNTHYQKLVEDEAELRQRNILMDYLGDGNLLYDPDEGFSVIDAEFEPQIPLRGKCMYHALIGMNALTAIMQHGESWAGYISMDARDNAIRVLELLSHAGHQPRFRLLFKVICESLGYMPEYAVAKDN